MNRPMDWLSKCGDWVMKPWSTNRRMPWPMDKVMPAVTISATSAPKRLPAIGRNEAAGQANGTALSD